MNSASSFCLRLPLTGRGITFKRRRQYFLCVRYDDVTYPVGKTIVKAKQWAFGLRPIHLSRACESGEAPERGKNGKQHDPVAGSTASMVKRDIAKKLISRLTVCELLYDP